MTVPSPRVPFRFESVARMATGRDLTSLIVPVKEGLAKLDQLSANMASSMMGAFLILRGESGSGKSTLLQTAGLFRDGIETVNVTRDEPIADALRALVPGPGAMRIVVVADREALGDTTEVEIVAAILATNAFIRSRAGERTMVVWPCNSDPIAEKLVEVAAQIGADALLGVEEPVFRYSGPLKADYLPIARKTIETFNRCYTWT